MLQAGPLQQQGRLAPSSCSRVLLQGNPWVLAPRCRAFSSSQCRKKWMPARASSSSSSSSTGSNYPDTWWQDLNQEHIQGPLPSEPTPTARNDEEGLIARFGEKNYERYIKMVQQHNQQEWDYIRGLAAERAAKGEMPPWFNPRWLEIEEAPPNTVWRQQGLRPLQVDPTWLGDGGGGDGGNAGGGSGRSGRGGGGWWREEDPYWPLRDWGDHPMRWWTWGLAALLAAGGCWRFLSSGSTESLSWGCGAAAALAIAAMGMSDMTDDSLFGHLGVKLAWATCVIVAAKEYYDGWQHQWQRYWLLPRAPHLEGTGWAAAAMAALYMLTGMSGLAHMALPTNPGEAFKWADIARKHLVWDYWGYGDESMR